jgi:hypothetical protein
MRHAAELTVQKRTRYEEKRNEQQDLSREQAPDARELAAHYFIGTGDDRGAGAYKRSGTDSRRYSDRKPGVSYIY